MVNAISRTDVFKQINNDFNGEFLREVLEKKRKPLNDPLILESFEQLHHINHLLFYHFGGITDGKGDLNVNLPAITVAQEQLEAELNNGVLITLGSRHHTEGSDPETTPDTTNRKYISKNAPPKIEGESATENSPTIPKTRAKKLKQPLQSTIEEDKKSSRSELLNSPQKHKILRKTNVASNSKDNVKLPLVSSRKTNSVERSPHNLNERSDLDSSRLVRENRSVEITKQKMKEKTAQLEQLFCLKYVPGASKLPINLLPSQKVSEGKPPRPDAYSISMMNTVLRSAGYDVSVDSNSLDHKSKARPQVMQRAKAVC